MSRVLPRGGLTALVSVPALKAQVVNIHPDFNQGGSGLEAGKAK